MAESTRTLPRARPGDVLSAAAWNALVDHINSQRITLGQNCGLEMQHNPWGTMLRVSRKLEPGYIATTTTSFAACSGSSCGSGSVQLLDMNSAGVLSNAAEPAVKAWNFASTSTGISSGVKVWVTIDAAGEFIITAAEC